MKFISYKRIGKKRILLVCCLAAAVFLGLAVYGGRVFAASSSMPDSSIGGPTPAHKYLLISVPTTGNSLDARVLYIKAYFRSSSGSIRIHDADFCGSNGSPDGITVLRNRYELFRTGGDEKYNNLNGTPAASYTSVDRRNSAGNCEKDGASRYVTLNVSGLTPSNVEGRNGEGGSQQYYVAVLKVSVAAGAGVNAFKLTTPSSGGIIGHAVNSLAFGGGGFCDVYTSGSGCYNWGPYRTTRPPAAQDAFAVQDRVGANNSFSTFVFEFAPNCNIKGSRTAYLKWFDLDVGTGNQSRTPSMELRRQPRGGGTETVVATKNSFLTGDARYETWGITIQEGYRYRWVWRDIQKTNGVQLWLPFDSANFNFDCPEPSNDAECEAFSWSGFPTAQSGRDIAVTAPGSGHGIISNASVSPGQLVHIGIRFKNTGNTVWRTDSGDTKRYGAFYEGDYLDGVEMVQVPSADMPSGNPFPVEDVTLPDGRLFRRVYPRTNINIPNTSGSAGSTIFWFAFRIPSDFSGSSLNASWQMAQFSNYEGRNSSRFGQPCEVSFSLQRNRPYISVDGGDVYSGARFGPLCHVSDDAQNADIVTNGYESSSSLGLDTDRGSSMAQYGVFASGNIISSSSSTNFFGNLGYAPDGATRRDMLFANEPVGTQGLFYGSTGDAAQRNFSTMPCINESSSDAPLASNAGAALSHIASGQGAMRHEGNLTLGNITIAGRKTLYVNGDVTIANSLQYSSSYASVASVPYLKIVANNIYIQSSADIVDGHFVAQATGEAEEPVGGVIDSCSNAGSTSAGAWPTTASISYCNQSLTVNGSLTAQKVLWKRTRGTVGLANEVVTSNSGCRYGSGGRENCSAEYINFSPEALISGIGGSSSISSVPLSTIELNPVY